MEKRYTHFRKQEFRDLIVELINLYKPRTYVEIGVAQGYIFNIVSGLVKRAFAVDPNMRNIKNRESVRLYKCISDDFFKVFKEPIDFCFIDGDHTSVQVRTDFDNAYRLLKVYSGLILMHDTYPIDVKLFASNKCCDAWVAVKEIKKEYQSAEVLTLPGPINGLTIIRKAPHYGWMDDS